MPNYIADTPTSTNLEEELLSGDAWLFNQPGLIEPIFFGLLHYGSETRLEAIKNLLAITVSAAQSEADSARRVVVSRIEIYQYQFGISEKRSTIAARCFNMSGQHLVTITKSYGDCGLSFNPIDYLAGLLNIDYDWLSSTVEYGAVIIVTRERFYSHDDDLIGPDRRPATRTNAPGWEVITID